MAWRAISARMKVPLTKIETTISPPNLAKQPLQPTCPPLEEGATSARIGGRSSHHRDGCHIEHFGVTANQDATGFLISRIATPVDKLLDKTLLEREAKLAVG